MYEAGWSRLSYPGAGSGTLAKGAGAAQKSGGSATLLLSKTNLSALCLFHFNLKSAEQAAVSPFHELDF